MAPQLPTVSGLGEHGLIEEIQAILLQGDAVVVGPGDDAAIVEHSGALVVSTDVLVDRRHFRRDWSSGFDIGVRAAAASMADIAAMGAVPTSLVVSLVLPPDVETQWVLDLAGGLRDEAAKTGASIVGGDISAGEGIVISVAATGQLPGRHVTRSGAQPGDVVAVAGRLGWAGAGLTILSRGFRSPRTLVDAHRRPEPPYESGPAAANNGATSMIDISDGLLADLAHVAKASDVAIDISTTDLEIPPPMREVSAALGADPLVWILGGGDDHALVATFASSESIPAGFAPIGKVTAKTDDALASVVTVDGHTWQGETGHEHFR